MTTERRADPRQRVANPYLVHVLSPDGRLLGIAVPEEVSAGGALLLGSRPWPPGTALALEPQRPHPLAGRPLGFRVTRCEPLPGGGYAVAGVFAPRLDDQDVQALAGGGAGPAATP